MQYRPILSQAWQITKNYKYLWVLGFFAVIISGAGGDFEVLMQNVNALNTDSSIVSNLYRAIEVNYLQTIANTVNNFLSTFGNFSWVIVLAVALVFVFLLWFMSLAQGGLYMAADKLSRGAGERGGARNGERKSFSLGTALQGSKEHVWTIFTFNIIKRGLLLLLSTAVALPFVAHGEANNVTSRDVLAFLSVTFMIIVPLSVMISFVARFGQLFAVLKNMHFREALQEAWVLLRSSWLITLETAFIFFVMYTVVGVGISVVAAVLQIPFLLLINEAIAAQSDVLYYGLSLIQGLLFFTLLIVSAAIVSVFEHTTWTLVFQRLVSGKRWAVLHRVLHPIIGSGEKGMPRRLKK